MTGHLSRKTLERAKMLSTLSKEEREQRAARQSLRAALWMVPTGIVVTVVIIVAWWAAQANHVAPSPVPRRFAVGDVFPWYVIIPVNLVVVWQLVRAWLTWRKVRRSGAGTPEQ